MHPLNSLESYRECAVRLFPGGSNGEYGIPSEKIPVIERGEGCWVWDTEGRRFLDMTMAWGAALVGHARPEVIEAAMKQAAFGANYAAVCVPAVDLAERITSLSPCMEKIRFVASGTEATLLCLRTAHAFTNKQMVLKFEGAYHGQHPVGVTSLVGRDLPDFPQPDPSGTGASWIEDTVLVAPFNDLPATQRIIEDHAGDLAAVIVEPLHRCIPPQPGFLEGLREVTARTGVVLIFDEVVTGFRLALGGAQEYYGVVPDLVAYGKALGGGFPIGAFGGKASLMEVVNESRLPGPNYAWSASTGGGNPVSCAAAMATLDVLKGEGVYPSLHAKGRKLREGLRGVLLQQGIEAQVLGDGPLAQVAFTSEPVLDHRSWSRSNRPLGRLVMLNLLEQGIFLNPMGTKLYLSLAHDEEALGLFLDKFDQALRAVLKSQQAPFSD